MLAMNNTMGRNKHILDITKQKTEVQHWKPGRKRQLGNIQLPKEAGERDRKKKWLKSS